MRHFVPSEFRTVFLSNHALRDLLATDLLVLLSELSAAVVLPWWITSSGGAGAMAAFSVTLAVASFVVLPAVSPFGDRICKSRQITWGLGGLSLIAATLAMLSFTGIFSFAGLAALAVLQVLATSFVNPARDAVLVELVPQAQMAVAIRMRKTTHAVGGILGPLLAGVVLGAAGVTAVCLAFSSCRGSRNF